MHTMDLGGAQADLGGAQASLGGARRARDCIKSGEHSQPRCISSPIKLCPGYVIYTSGETQSINEVRPLR